MEGGQRVASGLELESRADPERAEREADTGSLEQRLDPLAELAFELLRVRPLEAYRDVGHGRDAIEVDEDGNRPSSRSPSRSARRSRLVFPYFRGA